MSDEKKDGGSGKAADPYDNIRKYQWKKGQSGNPAGMTPGTRTRASIVRDILECKAVDGEEGTIADQLTRRQVVEADKGDTRAYQELMDAGYGKLKDVRELTNPEGGSFHVTIIDDLK